MKKRLNEIVDSETIIARKTNFMVYFSYDSDKLREDLMSRIEKNMRDQKFRNKKILQI